MIYSRYNTTSVSDFITNELAEYEDLNIYIKDIGLSRAGYGQYYAYILADINGVEKSISKYTTNSELFDCDDADEKQHDILSLITDPFCDYLSELI